LVTLVSYLVSHIVLRLGHLLGITKGFILKNAPLAKSENIDWLSHNPLVWLAWGPILSGLIITVAWALWMVSQIHDAGTYHETVQRWAYYFNNISTDAITPRRWRRLQNQARFLTMQLRVVRGELMGLAHVWQKIRLHWAAWVNDEVIAIPHTDEGLVLGLLALGLITDTKLLSQCSTITSQMAQSRDQEVIESAMQRFHCEPNVLVNALSRRLSPIQSPAGALYAREADMTILNDLIQKTKEIDQRLSTFLQSLLTITNSDLPRLPPDLVDRLNMLDLSGLDKHAQEVLSQKIATLSIKTHVRQAYYLQITGIFAAQI